MIRPPPPPPKPPRPRRVMPPPPTEPVVLVDFDLGPDEPGTPPRNVRVILYQKLVACVDHLSEKRADDLVEIACLFTDSTDDEQDVMLRVCRAVPRP